MPIVWPVVACVGLARVKTLRLNPVPLKTVGQTESRAAATTSTSGEIGDNMINRIMTLPRRHGHGWFAPVTVLLLLIAT